MARSGVTALSFAVLLAVVEIGSCLRCYQCNSQADPTCGDPFTSRKMIDCHMDDPTQFNINYLNTVAPRELISSVAGATRYCYKFVLSTGTVVRTCLDSNPSDLNHTCRVLENNKNPDGSKQFKHCSVCDKEGCNGAGPITASLPLATMALIASYFLFKQ